MKNAIRIALATAAVCTLFATSAAEARQYDSQSSSAASDQVQMSRLGRSDIVTIQTRLAERGFYEGNVDGSWGPMTTSAVSSFQESCGLSPTGRLTQATLSELDLASRNGDVADLDVEPAAGGAYSETTVTSEVYTTRGKRGFSAAEFDAQHSTCLECTDGIYGNGGKPDNF